MLIILNKRETRIFILIQLGLLYSLLVSVIYFDVVVESLTAFLVVTSI